MAGSSDLTATIGEEILPKLGVKSPVWTYFGMEAQSGDNVICRECRRAVSAKNGNTSNLFLI